MLNTQRYLSLVGWLLIAAALVGFVGLGPTTANSLFGQWLYFDIPQNLMHLLLGLFAITYVNLVKGDRALRIGSGLFGVIALVISVVGFLNIHTPVPNAGIFNLELIDTLLHLVIALWGFWVAFMPEGPIFVRDNQLKKA